ncbi:MAG: hypothetical protein JKY95_10320 [Planctomycetaceae bacterium]|nr:hypothetical protein [Planctomycetaceae bacterium]
MSKKQSWLRKMLLAVPLLFAMFCFWQALPDHVTSLQTAQAIPESVSPETQRQLVTKRIDQMQPADWGLASNPTGEEDLEFGRIVEPDAWRLLQLEAPKDDGSISEIQMLRPLWWLEDQWHVHLENKELSAEEHPFDLQKLITESIYISVPECGIDGWAKVLDIDKCPQISPRPGPEFQLVTATFKHHAKQILDVYIAGESDSIGTTPNHPFWSEDKQQFIRADELQPGEQLQKADGTITTVTNVVPRAGANTVYNLEVQLNHTYHVGKTGVLVHNGTPCFAGLARSGEPVVLIGRSMDRVNRAAGILRKKGLKVQTWDTNFEKLANPLEANRSWLRYWAINKNAKVIDIGGVKGIGNGDFYGMELRSVYKNWDIPTPIRWNTGF